MRRERGSAGDLMAAGICVLAMAAVMLVWMDYVSLLEQKMKVSQIARKYILRMETVGMLADEDRTALCEELNRVGVTDIRLDGTTLIRVGYGEPVTLQLWGRLREEYEFTEKRVSTAKH